MTAPMDTHEGLLALVEAELKSVRQEIVNFVDSGAQDAKPIQVTNGDLCKWFDRLEVVSGYLRNGVAQTSWQPIETAPKDGTPLLLGFPNNAHALVGHCEDDLWGQIDEDFGFKPWPMTPTHWMPIPTGPSVSSTDGNTP